MFEHKNRILVHYHQALERLHKHKWLLAGAGSIVLFGMMTAFALAPSANTPPEQLRTVLEQLSTPQASSLDSDANTAFLHEERIQRSDTVSSVIARLGISDAEAVEFIGTNLQIRTISRQLRPGKVLTAKTGESGKLISLHFPLNNNDTTTVVERKKEGLVVSEQPITLETHTAIKFGEIRSSLFAATDAAEIPNAIAIQMAEIFSSDIDFNHDLRKGDRFSVIYETKSHQGEPIRLGRIIAAEFVNNQEAHSAFWHQGKDGKGGYFSANGTSLRKPFLRSPLEFSRVTSGFSSARLHPVLQTMRAHKGIDLGAAIGTKVRSVADGVVEFAGQRGGYGNMIIIRHRATYSTAYGHLNGFSSGIRKGTRVSQGDTLGYVGRTGLATGPHLHYEFRINSKHVNPLAINLPAALPLDPQQISSFKLNIERPLSQLALARKINFAMLISS